MCVCVCVCVCVCSTCVRCTKRNGRNQGNLASSITLKQHAHFITLGVFIQSRSLLNTKMRRKIDGNKDFLLNNCNFHCQ